MWMRSLDTRGYRPGDLPVRSLFEIGQAVGQIGQLLTALNHIRDIPDDEYRTMEEVLQLLEGAIWEKIEAVETALGEPSGPRPEEAQEDEAGLGAPRGGLRVLYVLKVRLRGIRPPIWRRVRVPGSYTLAELHRVLQAVMGWGNHHLHSFSIGGNEYGDPATALKGFRCYRDEGRFTLDALLASEGEVFGYEYDFGDGWEHDVEVEKIVPLDGSETEDALRPLCLKGRRACPRRTAAVPAATGRSWRAMTDPQAPGAREVPGGGGGLRPGALLPRGGQPEAGRSLSRRPRGLTEEALAVAGARRALPKGVTAARPRGLPTSSPGAGRPATPPPCGGASPSLRFHAERHRPADRPPCGR